MELFQAEQHNFNPSISIPSAMCSPKPDCEIKWGCVLTVWLLTLWVHGFQDNYTHQLKNIDS